MVLNHGREVGVGIGEEDGRMPLFRRPKYTIVKVIKRREMPEGLWKKCEGCGEIVYTKSLEENLRVCPKCQHHGVLGAGERVEMLVDKGTFHEFPFELVTGDPLAFRGPKGTYLEKLQRDQAATGLAEAALSGTATLHGRRIALAVTDSRFLMGSMGSVVGEKVTLAIEHSTEAGDPLVIVSGTGGGARMHEGMFSLMQMAKTSAALASHHERGRLFISVLTDPTMAGVMASYASLGDVIVAEPGALIGFAGPRVIEQTIRQKLPPNFQRSEFLLEHGLIDLIVHRKDLRATVSRLLAYCCGKDGARERRAG